MKSRKWARLLALLLIVAFVFCGCSAKQDASEEEWLGSAKTRPPRMDEDAGGFYFFSQAECEYLHYYDEETGTAVKVCAKANCSHDSASCNARFGNWICPHGIQVYQGRVYVWGESYDGDHLYSVQPDGSDRVEYGIMHPEDNSSCGVVQSVIYDDWVYTLCNTGVNAQGFSMYRIYRQKLEKNQTAEVLYEGDPAMSEHQFSEFSIQEGALYFCDTAYGEDSMTAAVYRYDPESGKTEEVLLTENRTISFVVVDGQLYYSMFDYESGEWGNMFVCSPDTGEEELFSESGGIITFDGECFYVEKYSTAEGFMGIAWIEKDGREEELIRDFPDELSEHKDKLSVSFSQNYIMIDYFDYSVDAGEDVWYVCRKGSEEWKVVRIRQKGM